MHVEVEVIVEGVVAVDGVEVVVPVGGDIVVVGGGGPWRWQQSRWRLGVGDDVECLACRRWVAGSSLRDLTDTQGTGVVMRSFFCVSLCPPFDLST